jgi:chromosome segregation ATPase
MAIANSQNDVIRLNEGLLEAVDRMPELQPEVQKERQAVEESLTEVKTLKAQQEDLTAKRQEITQRLTAALVRLREAGMQLRALVRAKLGLRNERLVQFSVAPLRKRSRGRVVVVEKPVNGKPAETDSPSAKPVA